MSTLTANPEAAVVELERTAGELAEGRRAGQAGRAG